MIIRQEFETLESSMGYGKINLKELIQKSRNVSDSWNNYIVENEEKTNFSINDSLKFVFNPKNDELTRITDISEFAFSQLCSRVGIPAGYVKKCFERNKEELAIQNFQSWAQDMNQNILVRENNGVVRAVLSDSYVPFDSYKVLKTLNNTVDDTLYRPNQVFLSEDKLHIRFIGYEPLPFDNEELYAGFTVDSSDVGRGSLNMKFFIYRPVCTNGMVVSKMGGTLFRQNHIGSNMNGGKLELFNRAFTHIDRLTAMSVRLIKENSKQFLKDYELNMYLEKAKRDLHLSEKSQEKLISLIDNTYDRSKWGIINSVTELAQDFTLETRLDLENWAGELFLKVA